MAKAPKNEQNIKTAIALLVTTHTSMKTKAIENIILKQKTFDYSRNGVSGNWAVRSEKMIFWTKIYGSKTDDYTAFENAVHSATSTAFNGLQILSVRELDDLGNWLRLYEIEVN